MSSFLIDDRPLIVLPALAKLLGSVERALVLQQIHWLCQQPKSGEVDEDGHKWIWGTLHEWCEDYFSMWSVSTLKRHLRWLRTHDYLAVDQRSSNKWDKTNYYRINYPALEECDPSRGEHADSSKGADVDPSRGEHADSSKREDVDPSPTETSTKTSTKTSTEKQYVSFDTFWDRYPRKTNRVKAEASWVKLKPDKTLFEKIARNIQGRLDAGDWDLARKDVIPHATTYLNNARWEDEIIARSQNETGRHSGRSIVDRVRNAAIKRARERQAAIHNSGRTIDEDGSIVDAV